MLPEGNDAGTRVEAWEVRTDLATEAHAVASRRRSMDGVMVEERRDEPDITVQRVRIESRDAGERIGKAPGRYVTIHSPQMRHRSRSHGARVAAALAEELEDLLHLKANPKATVLLVGLGNWNATPDALGPRVVEQVLVTRHMGEAVPEELRGSLRTVAAVAPGVLGITGMETGEIVRGIVNEIHPDRVVCVDALACQDPDRLTTTIQLADTGIRPGSGVGNHRAALTEETLGVPTIAVGVPTVVHAISIVESSMKQVTDGFRGRGKWSGLFEALGQEMGDGSLLRDMLWPKLGSLMVTPKEIDQLIEEVAWVIAGSLNAVLHPGIDLSDFGDYAQHN